MASTIRRSGGDVVTGRVVERVRKLGRPLIQVAMDYTNVIEALRLIKKLSGLGVDIYEVGTPLIKSEGMRSIITIKELVDESLVLADMKTADTGGLEVRLAASNGADAITVLASSNNEVILSAINEGNTLNVDIVADTIGRINPTSIIDEIVTLGVKIINLHLAIDVQLATGKDVADIAANVVKRIKNSYSDLIVSVSGGIKPHHIKELVKCGADVIVMGSAVTKASNPAEVVKEALKLLI